MEVAGGATEAAVEAMAEVDMAIEVIEEVSITLSRDNLKSDRLASHLQPSPFDPFLLHILLVWSTVIIRFKKYASSLGSAVT